nr:hypothetical protein [Tanacetum cinerariifolium]
MIRSGPGRSSVRSGLTRHNLRVFGKTGPDQPDRRPNWFETPDRGPDQNTFGLVRNPLFLQNNDHSNMPIVGFENYKMRSTAMKIALTGKNKMGFIDGTCVKPDELKETYDKMDGFVIFNVVQKITALKQGDLSVPECYHTLNSLWREFDILSLLPTCTCAAHERLLKRNQLVRLMPFLMGLNDVYQPTRSILLARDLLPDVKDAFAVVSREESHRGLAPGKPLLNPILLLLLLKLTMHCGLIGHTIERCYELNGYPASFKRNPNLSKQSGFVKKFSGNNVDMSLNALTSSGSMSASFTNEQMVKLLSLINEKPAANSGSYVYNVTLGWIIDSGANQHMTTSIKNMFNVVDISSLKLSIGHPNGTMANITAIGSLRLTENVVLFDILIIPEYTVNLLSVNKMIKDIKYFVRFNKSKCYIQDLKLGKIVGTGSESGGLYMFHCDHNGKAFVGMSNSGILSYVSKELRHCRLGHPTNQVLSILNDKIGFKTGDYTSACDICHKTKQTMGPFPLSDYKSSKIGDLIHFDVWGPYKVTSRDSPNDEEGSSFTEDDSARVDHIQNEGVVPLITQIEDNLTPEGNSLKFSIGGGFGLRDVSQTEVRRSSRPNSQPMRSNDYVVSSNVKRARDYHSGSCSCGARVKELKGCEGYVFYSRGVGLMGFRGLAGRR